MNRESEYEMAVHIAAAFSHVKEALAFGGDYWILNEAEIALRKQWGLVSEENRRLVDLSAFSSASELRHV